MGAVTYGDYGVFGDSGDKKLLVLDILGLGELAVRNGGHHAERREQCRPDCGATPLDHLHHIPEGPNNPSS